MLIVFAAIALAAFAEETSEEESVVYTTEVTELPDPTSRSGVPKTWVVLISCIGSLAVVTVSVVILCCKKPPMEGDAHVLLASREY